VQNGLDAPYEHLREAALHTRAQAFPLGFGVLRRAGVTGWRRALTGLGGTVTPPAIPTLASPSRAPAPLPTTVTTELIHVLAAVALAGTKPNPNPTPTSSPMLSTLARRSPH
jgi:hypothetical protein